MNFKIKSGKHRAWPITVGLFYKKKTMRRVVTFGQGCAYWLDGPDMMDTNKLFGIGYFWNHHKESARFGWRYDNAKNIIISAYVYRGGVREIFEICKVPLFKKITFALYDEKSHYVFDVLIEGAPVANEWIPKFHRKKWSFPLGLYFGGNKPAPNDIHVEMKKV